MGNNENGKLVNGIDVPIVKLVPRNERKVSKKHYERIEASLRAVGLIEPLIVFPQGDNYEILVVMPLDHDVGYGVHRVQSRFDGITIPEVE